MTKVIRESDEQEFRIGQEIIYKGLEGKLMGLAYTTILSFTDEGNPVTKEGEININRIQKYIRARLPLFDTDDNHLVWEGEYIYEKDKFGIIKNVLATVDFCQFRDRETSKYYKYIENAIK